MLIPVAGKGGHLPHLGLISSLHLKAKPQLLLLDDPEII